MIESIPGTESKNLNTGEVVNASPPPSSPEINGTGATIPSGVEVDLQSEIAQDVNKNRERVAGVQKSDESLEKELKETVDSLNEKLDGLGREVLFKVDKRINRNYISVVDKDSQEVIREFPPKDIRTYIARFDEFHEQLNSSSDVKSLIVNLEV